MDLTQFFAFDLFIWPLTFVNNPVSARQRVRYRSRAILYVLGLTNTTTDGPTKFARV